jgi:hypothetical protein
MPTPKGARRRQLRALYALATVRAESLLVAQVQPRLNKSRFKGQPSAVSAGCTLRIAPDASRGNHLTTPPSAQATFSRRGRGAGAEHERATNR